jgi:hypothetical protein
MIRQEKIWGFPAFQAIAIKIISWQHRNNNIPFK